MRNLKTAVLAFALSAASLGAAPAQAEIKSLVVAGGCFWCVESDFDHMDGVVATTSGYGGGEMQNPTYRNHGKHREVVKVDYDDTKTDYRTLVTQFLRTIDVTDAGGQFCDRGHSYTTAIHAGPRRRRRSPARRLPRPKRARAENRHAGGGPATFWPAEDYHQGYYMSQEKVLTRFGFVTRARAYKGYRKGCGRDRACMSYGAIRPIGCPQGKQL
jgi:peptide-methionine (S)-S-oxide reductase